MAAITPSFVSCTTGCWELSCQTTTFGWKQRDLREGIIFRTSQCSTAWRASLRLMIDAPFCTRRCVQARWERLTKVETNCMQSIDVCTTDKQTLCDPTRARNVKHRCTVKHEFVLSWFIHIIKIFKFIYFKVCSCHPGLM